MRRREFIPMAAAGTLVFAADTPGRPIELRSGDRVATKLYFGDAWDKPFVYPLETVSGRVVSRGFPLEPREGDSKDHLWHRGIWYGHGIINGADFWREQGRDKTGRLVVKAAPRVTRSAVSVDLALTPPAGAPFGTVRQEFRVEDRDRLRTIDATITISADAGQSLTFGDTEDGGFAFRVAEAFREDRGAQLRNSDGLAGSKNIWGKPARWVDYSAVIDGSPAGVAIFDHPKNLRHPVRWHARNYGLCAANPFALKGFTKDPTADGGYTLPSGRQLVLRYRTLIHEGPFEPADLEKLYAKFAQS